MDLTPRPENCVYNNSNCLIFRSKVNSEKGVSEEVNEYLSRAIDARSIDRLRRENIHPVSLAFIDPQIENKVATKLDDCMLLFFTI